MQTLSPQYRTFVVKMLEKLTIDPVKEPISCPEAGYMKSSNEEVNLYRHLLLLRDDMRYHVMYGETKPKNFTRYVNMKYPTLMKRIKDIYYRRGLPNWDRIAMIERAGIDVVWDREERKLQFHIEGSILIA